MTLEKAKKIESFNKKARFDYEIVDSFEAGIVLNGDEIKAIRKGQINLTGSYVKILNGELYWVGGEINVLQGDRQRTRKLLMHKSEIGKLAGKTVEEGLTLIPLKLYMKSGRAKIEVGLGRGMKKYDKRAVLKKKEQSREVEREIKQF